MKATFLQPLAIKTVRDRPGPESCQKKVMPVEWIYP
jgi:hypothetical protein